MSAYQPSSPEAGAVLAPGRSRGWGEGLARLLLARWPLGPVVHWIAGLRASVHTKLLCGFALVTLLVVAMGAMSLRTIARMSSESQLLDEAHERVDLSRQIEHSLAMQMNFTSMALLLKDEAAVARILRENNRFNNTLARIEKAAPPEERALIRAIRDAQELAMTAVADIANLIRDGKLDEATRTQLGREYPLLLQIEGFVNQVVKMEQDRMEGLRLSVAAENRRAMILMVSFIVALILLAQLLGFVISWSFILPVREAHGFLSQVAKGNFSTTITVPNRDEFGDLAARMNQMSRELQQFSEDHRQAAQQLKRLNEDLERASKAKSDFLSSMSHELRTPMNAILGFTEMISEGIYGEVPPSFKEPVSDIHTCGKQLLRLINDVLDLSKIEAGRMELSLSEYLVQDSVDTVRHSLRSLAAEKGLEFVAAAQENIPPVLGDGKRITQCLTNLAGNALKFTKQGRVEIGAERQGETVLFRVSDTGIGISPDQVQNIFTEFRQGDPTISREFGGTGLGLSITKKFIEMHGGRIWVETELGKGATFFFTIPLRVDREERA